MPGRLKQGSTRVIINTPPASLQPATRYMLSRLYAAAAAGVNKTRQLHIARDALACVKGVRYIDM